MLPGYELPPRLRFTCAVLKWASILTVFIFIAFLFVDNIIDNVTAHFWNELSKETQTAIKLTEAKQAQVRAFAYIGWFSPCLILAGSYRVFRALERGQVFSLRTVKALRFLGLMILIEAIFRSVFSTLMILLMTYDASDGHKTLSLSVGTHQLIAILVGALILIIGQIFTQAVRISDENRQIV